MAETILVLKPYAIAFLGGVLPALVWLWFWHRQDRECPEPKGLVALSFMAGMVVVFFVLPLQKVVVAVMPTFTQLVDFLALKYSFIAPESITIQNILLSATEEFGKYATVFLIAFHSRNFDEPIDAVIYLVTAALGFAAIENALYILKDLAQSGGADVLLNGNLRFLGATILHTVSSAFIGIALAFSFFAPRLVKIIAATAGILIATLLHAQFNLSIIGVHGTTDVLALFSRYWMIIIGIIVLVAMIKHINNRHNICPIE